MEMPPDGKPDRHQEFATEETDGVQRDGLLAPLPEQKQRETHQRVRHQNVSPPDQCRVDHPNHKQDRQPPGIERNRLAPFLRPRHLHRESQAKQKRKKGDTLPLDEKVDESLRDRVGSS